MWAFFYYFFCRVCNFSGGAISYSLKTHRPWRKFNHLSWQHNERAQGALWSAWQLLSMLMPLPYLHLCWHSSLRWKVALFMTVCEKQPNSKCRRAAAALSDFLFSSSPRSVFLHPASPHLLPSSFPPYPVSHCSFLPRSLWSLNLARDSSGGMSSCVAFWGCPQCLQEVVHSNRIFMVWAFCSTENRRRSSRQVQTSSTINIGPLYFLRCISWKALPSFILFALVYP